MLCLFLGLWIITFFFFGFGSSFCSSLHLDLIVLVLLFPPWIWIFFFHQEWKHSCSLLYHASCYSSSFGFGSFPSLDYEASKFFLFFLWFGTFRILFLWIMHHLLSLIWNFFFLAKWNHSSSLDSICVF